MIHRDLYLYNTASRSKELFEPVGGEIGIYCCGPTVYDNAHIGNLRTYLWEDALKRTLYLLGYKVKHVMNITDVGHLTSDEDTGEDKVEKGARREGKTAWEIAAHYTDAFKKDFLALNCIEPDVWCRATDHIAEMIALIAALEKKGFTYTTGDGVYFDTTKFPAYADFARLNIESLIAGARIEMGDKKNPTDFALWKFSPAGTKRQMEWKSPWGVGFPGWHIECSAMSLKYLTQPIDIHCGGQEHVRIHHTNEIAQSEAATGKKFVRFWLHGEWLLFDTGKMSKSGGGTVMLDEIKKKGIPPLAYRMFALSAHYRGPVNFTWDGVRASANGLKGLKKHIVEINARAGGGESGVSGERLDKVLDPFLSALCDDLNTPQALAAVWELARDGKATDAEKIAAIQRADSVLGLGLLVPDKEDNTTKVFEKDGAKITVVSRPGAAAAQVEAVADKVARRTIARKDKNFKEADALRAELTAMHVEVKDLPDGSVECVIK
jgi:cysteinyl-tRNA synthetase